MPVDRLKIVARFGAKPVYMGDVGIRDGKVFFQYASEALEQGRSFSPVHIHPDVRVQSFNLNRLPPSFMGLPGMLADALPDSWGRALFRRQLAKRQISTQGMTALDLLSFIGETGMGVFAFYPLSPRESISRKDTDMEVILAEVSRVQTTTDAVSTEFLSAALPSGGARPKVLVQRVDDRLFFSQGTRGEQGESWLLKFPDKNDPPDSGVMEYRYHQLAREAGIRVPDAELWADKYFAVKRFDRQGDSRLHMHSLSGMLHREFTDFSITYDDFFVLTRNLTESVEETLEAMRRAIFNRLFENMDDHGKNHAYIMDEDGRWVLSPAYDLTRSTLLGIHPMSWLGSSSGLPARGLIVEQAESLGVREKDILACIEQVELVYDAWRNQVL